MAVVALLLVALSSCTVTDGGGGVGETGSLKLSMTEWDRARGAWAVEFTPDPRSSDFVTCSDDVCNYTTFPPGTYTVEVVQGQTKASRQFTIKTGQTTETEILPPPE